MPSTIKVISWNIQNIGDSKLSAGRSPIKKLKAAQNATLDYILTVIEQEQPDVVGILEILGSKATYIKQQLLVKLKTNGNWMGIESSRQTSSARKEQYIYLWKVNTIGISGYHEDELNPSPAWTYNIVDANSMRSFFDSIQLKLPSANRRAIYQELEENRYIIAEDSTDTAALKKINASRAKAKKKINDDEDEFLPKGARALSSTQFQSRNLTVDYTSVYVAYRVNPEKWNSLKNEDDDFEDENGNTITMGLTTTQLEKLKETLILVDIVLFPNAFERGPFLLTINLKDKNANNYPLTLALFHAPAPEKNELPKLSGGKRARGEPKFVNDMKFEAINNLSLCPPIVEAKNLLLMGDFNVNYGETTAQVKNVVEYCRKDVIDPIDDTAEFMFTKSGKKKNLSTAFQYIISKPVFATDLMGATVNTSLTSQKSGLTGSIYDPDWGENADDYLANPYDKFFLRSDDGFTKKNAACLDLIRRMDRNDTTFNKSIAEAGMTYMRWKGDIDFVQSQIDELEDGIVDINYALNQAKANAGSVAGTASTAKATSATKRRKIKKTEVDQLQAQLDEAQRLLDNAELTLKTLRNLKCNVPPDAGIAFIVYRLFSDHLPINTNINYGA